MHDTRDVHVFLPGSRQVAHPLSTSPLLRGQRHTVHVEQYLKDHRSQVYANCQTPSEILGRRRKHGASEGR